MTEAVQRFKYTHFAPAAGMPTWPSPGSSSAGPRLDPHLPVQLRRELGDWAEIVCSNGWGAWVDRRKLVPAPSRTASSGPTVVAAAVATTATGFGRPVPQSGPFVVPSAKTWPVVVGSLLVVGSVLLPWITFGRGTSDLNALDVPAGFLFNTRAADSRFKVGTILVLLGFVAVVLGHVRATQRLARIPGVLCAVAVVLFVVQLHRLLRESEELGLDHSLFDVLGFGVLPCMVGTLLLLWGPRR